MPVISSNVHLCITQGGIEMHYNACEKLISKIKCIKKSRERLSYVICSTTDHSALLGKHFNIVLLMMFLCYIIYFVSLTCILYVVLLLC